MTGNLFQAFDVIIKHGVPAVIIGGHAVNSHGYIRATEDIDIIFIRDFDSEIALAAALASLGAYWIGDEIDAATGIEKTHPVTLNYVRHNRLMMLGTDVGFLDVFDFVPGLPEVSPSTVLDESVMIGGRRFASLAWLRAMKRASGRPIDLVDLEKLPDPQHPHDR